jgi:hypothetical protein
MHVISIVVAYPKHFLAEYYDTNPKRETKGEVLGG